MPYLPPVGRCIYCLSTEGLTDEHIIPQSLGGNLILQKASCETCRKITSEFERVVAREMYWPLRLRSGLVGSRKHKKERPTHWIGVLKSGDNMQDMPIEVGKFPPVYAVMEMAPPGIITKQPLIEGNPEMKIHLVSDVKEVEQFMRELGVGDFEVSSTLEWASFSRMIAKICHAYAVSVVGLNGVNFFLPQLIRGESNYLAQYVGGTDSLDRKLDQGMSLGLWNIEINGIPYLSAATTIFGNRKFPTYQAIIGQILDLDLVLTKMAAAQRAG